MYVKIAVIAFRMYDDAMTAMTAGLPAKIRLRASYDCCGSVGPCTCWCHNPNEGGTNWRVADLEAADADPAAKKVFDWMNVPVNQGRDPRSYSGEVEWLDGGGNPVRLWDAA